MPNFKFNMDFVPVPRDFIEHIMPSSNASYVMVYIYILMLASTGKNISTAEIAKKLGLIESDVVNAIKYWNNKGVMYGTGDNIIIKKSVDEEISPETDKKSIEDISEIINGNKALSDLCTISQEILGKTLANSDIETLYWFYDELGFSPEVIAMLLEYCASMGKRNMKYIEKVALTWHENNITTMDDAQAYITNAASRSDYVSTLRRLFGITERNLSQTEKSYIESWRDELKMSSDMVGLAYDYCVLAVGKLSFPYINTILKRWAEQNIHTIPDAERDHESFRQQNNRESGGTETQGISDIERQFMSNYDK